VGTALLALAMLCPVSRGEDAQGTGRGVSLGVATRILGEDWRESEAYWASGVMVTRVAPGSAAERAGMAPGDILVSVDSRVLHNPGDLMEAESGMERGRPVPVVVARDAGRVIRIFNLETDAGPAPGAASAGSRQTAPGSGAGDAVAEAVPPQAPGENARPAPEPELSSLAAATSQAAPAVALHFASGELGVRGENLDWDRAEELGATEGRGVFVVTVAGGSAAETAGIQPGDVITWACGQPVADMDGLERIVATAPSPLSIVTVRRGTTRPVTVEFAAPVPPAHGIEPPASPEHADATASDALVLALRDEVRSLREEVRKLREELASLARGTAERR
jgi:membrane-associated protease RseP (regulator of RpoE activity)